ncbi:hypothetical protein MNEG_7899 [Monoraphidium neglectum]|uniref:Patatin n=1 Tax=Monoraphidium neglectum TaxID=145388 RepID=A0A0D2KXT6_9CHLO|nr:hypothetical protein MNEG_7899 [Monoraphidium neglectum]KIZ00064.1 hypothetical protein MNEG_7899 [Monoraphidium neglectum]|eukprot:XP_013899083.1 hypothetical protein MNEG_7899 [Monoraphidium neglectum]
MPDAPPDPGGGFPPFAGGGRYPSIDGGGDGDGGGSGAEQAGVWAMPKASGTEYGGMNKATLDAALSARGVTAGPTLGLLARSSASSSGSHASLGGSSSAATSTWLDGASDGSSPSAAPPPSPFGAGGLASDDAGAGAHHRRWGAGRRPPAGGRGFLGAAVAAASQQSASEPRAARGASDDAAAPADASARGQCSKVGAGRRVAPTLAGIAAAAGAAVAGAAARVARAASLASLHPAVRAHLEGSLGIAFSGGGFRYAYFLGVGEVLLDLGLVDPSTRVSGASSGSLGAVLLKCGFDARDVLLSTLNFAVDVRQHGIKGRLGPALRSYLQTHLPPCAGASNNGTTFLAVTQVWPSVRTMLHYSFGTKDELIDAMLASCHLPSISDGSITVRFKQRPHIDGGLLSVLTPPPDTTHTVNVCSMPSRQIARLPLYITRPAQSEISISPDSYQQWPYNRRETCALAVAPPQDEFIVDMYQRGLHDARSWAEAVGLTRDGRRLWPTAQELGRAPLPVWLSANARAGAAPAAAAALAPGGADAVAFCAAAARAPAAAAAAGASEEAGGEALVATAALAAGGRLGLSEVAGRPGRFFLAPDGGDDGLGGATGGSTAGSVSDLQLLVSELGVPQPRSLSGAMI